MNPAQDDNFPALTELLARARRDAEGLSSGPCAGPNLPPPPPGYEIRHRVSRGGQGTVFDGVHRATGRRVALKLLRDDRDEPEDRSRFCREIALLNRIDHPGIVPVRDSVEVEGRIWHVMDFIDGRPVDEWAREEGPSCEQALALVGRIADAVGAAHARGIVHRDLKPSNILVDRSGAPHVLDFGLAKLVTADDEQQGLTVAGQFVGSVAWASPEQAEGRNRDVDTRSDVYALGVITYAVLSGRMPYPIDGSLRQTLDHIVRSEPVPLRRVAPEVDSDIEAIVLMCLEKEPSRRYQGAAELAADVRRRLSGAPIAARSASGLYLASKLIRRHRWSVAAGIGAVALLAAGFVTVLTLYIERGREATISNEISDFFVTELLTNVDPIRGAGKDARVIDVVDEAAQSLDGRFSDRLIDARLRRTLGAAYRELSERDKAEPLLVQAVDTLTALASVDDPERLEAMAALARLRLDQGRPLESEAVLRDALSVADPDGRMGLVLREDLGVTLAALGRLDEAALELDAILAARRAERPANEGAILNSLENVAGVRLNGGDAASAEPLYREALAGFVRLKGPEHPRTAVAMANLAACLTVQGRLDEARPLAEDALRVRESKLGPTHARTLEALEVVGDIEQRAGNTERVRALLEDLVGRCRLRGMADDPVVLGLRRRLALAWLGDGRAEEAVREFEAVLNRQRELFGADGMESIETQRLLAKALRTLKRYGEAESLLADAIERLDRMPADGSAGATKALAAVGLGLTRAERGDGEGGLEQIERALQEARALRGLDDPVSLFVLEAAWHVASDTGRCDRADAHALAMIEAMRRGAPVSTATLGEWLIRRAQALACLGRDDEAQAHLTEAVTSEPARADEVERARATER